MGDRRYAADAYGSSSNRGPNFRWWIPADGIRRDVITADIQRYLGSEAVVKPGEGRDADRVSILGYRILDSN